MNKLDRVKKAIHERLQTTVGLLNVDDISSGGGFEHMIYHLNDGRVLAWHYTDGLCFELSYKPYANMDDFFDARTDQGGFGWEQNMPEYENRVTQCLHVLKKKAVLDQMMALLFRNGYWKSPNTDTQPKGLVRQRIPKSQMDIVVTALMCYRDTLRATEKLADKQGSNDVAVQHQLFDCHSLIGLMDREVVVELTEDEYDNFLMYGVDFPEYTGDEYKPVKL